MTEECNIMNSIAKEISQFIEASLKSADWETRYMSLYAYLNLYQQPSMKTEAYTPNNFCAFSKSCLLRISINFT